MSNHFNSLQKGLLDWSDSLYRFTDGSMLLSSVNGRFAGMGGNFKDGNNNLLFIFLGRLQVNSALLPSYGQ